MWITVRWLGWKLPACSNVFRSVGLECSEGAEICLFVGTLVSRVKLPSSFAPFQSKSAAPKTQVVEKGQFGGYIELLLPGDQQIVSQNWAPFLLPLPCQIRTRTVCRELHGFPWLSNCIQASRPPAQGKALHARSCGNTPPLDCRAVQE